LEGGLAQSFGLATQWLNQLMDRLYLEPMRIVKPSSAANTPTVLAWIYRSRLTASQQPIS
jgi:hypothetical protein